MERHIRYLMEADEVDMAVETFEQMADGLGVAHVVVDTAKNDVFERQTALVGKVIVAQQLYDVLDGHTLLGRHELLTLLVDRGVEADGHLAVALFKEPLQLVLDTDRTHGDALRAPGPAVGCRKNLCRLQHVVEVVHGLALSHIDDIRQTVNLWKTVDLIEDVGRSEIALEALLTRLAEQAIHLAPHLAGNAECGMATLLGDIDRLDKLGARRRTAISRTSHRLCGAYREEVFHSSIFRPLLVNGRQAAYLIFRG